MSDFGTMAEQARLELRVGSSRLNEIKLKIIESIQHYRPLYASFLETDFSLATVKGKSIYGPDDGIAPGLAQILGDMWVSISGNQANRQRLYRKSPDFIQALDEYPYSSWPRYWCAWGKDQFRIYPAPNEDGHLLDFRAIELPPAPMKKMLSDKTWEFSDDSFTNGWFLEGYNLVLHYTKYAFLRDIQRAPDLAQASLTAALEEEQSLITATASRELPDHLDPWPAMGSDSDMTYS